MEDAVAFIALTGCLGVSVFTDVAAGYVFDVVTLPSLAAAFLMAAIEGRAAQVFGGALCVSSALLLLYGLSRGRGIGLGDAKLAACAGALLGITDGFIALGIAFVLGGIYAAILLLGKRAERKQSVAFAPYIAAGVFAVLSFRTV
jgi:leader peptidase (prepilin peptidase)/N-methyltransferase